MAVVVQIIRRVVGEQGLTPAVIERLQPYVTRYAQTMGIAVFAVGGQEDHLHILFRLPEDKTLKMIDTELAKTTTRFVRESLALPGFAWAEEPLFLSVSADEVEECAAYILDNPARHASRTAIAAWETDEEADGDDDAVPEWLRTMVRP
ncbi:MAG: transposase [Capsulimonadales bacterium]|nr:transposase [Capsulimonadales bacterium]